MSEWRDISTAPRDGVFVLLHNDHWSSDVEGFWHKGSQSWSANTRIPGIENRAIRCKKKAGDCTSARGSRFEDQDPIALTRFVGS